MSYLHVTYIKLDKYLLLNQKIIQNGPLNYHFHKYNMVAQIQFFLQRRGGDG